MHVLNAAAAAIAALCLVAGPATAQTAPIPYKGILPSSTINQMIADTAAAQIAAAAAQAGLAGKQDVQPLAVYLFAGQSAIGLTTAAFDAAPAINALLAARLDARLPCGIYAINTPITGMTRDGASLTGTPGCVVFNVGFATGDVIPLSGTHFQAIRDIAFNAVVARTSGAAIHQYQTANNFMDRLTFYGLWSADAMLMDGSNTTFINDFNCSNGPLFQVSAFRSGGACIHIVGNALEVHIKHGLAARFDKGIQITYGSGVYAEGVDAVQCGIGILFDPNGGAGQSVFGVQMANVLGDTSYADNWLLAGTGPITDIQIANSWASSSSGSSGFTVTNAATNGLFLSNFLMLGNYGDGMNIVAGSNIAVTGGGAEYNNITNASAGSGYHLHAGVSKVSITGARAGAAGTYSNVSSVINHQVTGIQVDTGAGDYLSFTGNVLVGNVAAPMVISATGPNIKTSGNAGFTEVAGGATQLNTGQTTLVIPTTINAPDARIIFTFAPITSYAACGITGMSSTLVSSGSITMTANASPTSPCQFYWRASSWGN